MSENKYLRLLAREYPNMEAAASEVVNLSAIRCLPKGTEYFFSDIHGEYEAFLHLLRSASGVIRFKINEVFSRTISEEELDQLAALIYYPEEYLGKITLTGAALEDWQRITIFRLVEVCRAVSSKYTRSKVRKKLPPEFAYIIDELLHADNDVDKERYYGEIANAIVDNGIAGTFITALCDLIRALSVDRLHIIGDIFDRGPRADIIMEELISFHDVDIQWGNHDISWMGAAAGNQALIANVVRMAVSYNNFDLLEDGYGINLRALSEFAAAVYQDDECSRFLPRVLDENKYDTMITRQLAAKMHKAIAVIQFKLEGQLIRRHPEYEMDDRILLEAIDYDKGTVTIGGETYSLMDVSFPTVNPRNPLELTRGEKELMRVLTASFRHSSLLHKHIRFLYSRGSVFLCANQNLLYHGCIPMEEDGSFTTIQFPGGKSCCGKELFTHINQIVNRAYFDKNGTKEQSYASDFMWYLWCGSKSPLFGKSKLSAFEHYFLDVPELTVERYNPYYKLSQKEEVCNRILEEFGLGGKPGAHIINGHVPVKIKEGESPIKAGGKLFIIDGGISKAYQSKTGIAGYTMIFNSHGLDLAEHTPFSKEMMMDFRSNTPRVTRVETAPYRLTVRDTDEGAALEERIQDLRKLIRAYRKGEIRENTAFPGRKQ